MNAKLLSQLTKMYTRSISLQLFIFIEGQFMSSLKSLTEETNTDRNDIHNRVLAHLKTYTFFVFYQPSSNTSTNHSLNAFYSFIQKLHFKIKDEKSMGASDLKNSDSSRLVQIQFYNLESESQKTQGLLDLKQGGLQSKSKIVAYCQEERLAQLLNRASHMEIDLANIPIILTYSHPNSDFAIFGGWGDMKNGDFTEMSISDLEKISKKWIQSAQEKVDVWTLSIKLQQGGRLQKLVGRDYKLVEVQSVFQQRFLSHFSLGYHVRLSKNYIQRCRQPENRSMNKMIYGWERFKQFCCLKDSNMRSSTGVVNINYMDQKGETFQILKHLREYQGSEQSELEASRVIKSDRGILSLLVANIDRFHGNKLNSEINCKPGDGRTEIIVFEGVNKCRRIASVGGEIILKLQSEAAIQMQVGESIYRCWGCKQLRIKQSSRIKISINKDVLEC